VGDLRAGDAGEADQDGARAKASFDEGSPPSRQRSRDLDPGALQIRCDRHERLERARELPGAVVDGPRSGHRGGGEERELELGSSAQHLRRCACRSGGPQRPRIEAGVVVDVREVPFPGPGQITLVLERPRQGLRGREDGVGPERRRQHRDVVSERPRARGTQPLLGVGHPARREARGRHRADVDVGEDVEDRLGPRGAGGDRDQVRTGR